MTEKWNGIQIAPWAVGAIASLLIAIMGLTVRASVRQGHIEANIEHNKTEIKRLDNTKASQEKVDDTYNAILRLERKFDSYVQDHN